MYKLTIIDINNEEVFNRYFLRQKDIIKFTNNCITYNDFKPRKHEKKYRTYKNYFKIEKV
jgi:hypothetical protein